MHGTKRNHTLASLFVSSVFPWCVTSLETKHHHYADEKVWPPKSVLATKKIGHAFHIIHTGEFPQYINGAKGMKCFRWPFNYYVPVI